MKERIENLIRAVAAPGAVFQVAVSERPSFGHYSTNIALRLSGAEKKSPLRAAEELVEKIRKHAPLGFFEKVEIAPPGFINFWLSPETIQGGLREILARGARYGRGTEGKGKTVIVEYSQPNIAKRMHVGHLRTTVLGDALANLYEFLGYRVVRWNYFGDWGTQFGKLIAAYKLWGSEKTVRAKPIQTLLDLYIRFHDEMKSNPELESRGREEFRKLEEGDRENRKLWEWFKKESLREFHGIYKRLGIKFDVEMGEAFFEKDMKPLVDELVQAGIAQKSEGSLVIPLPGSDLPALIQKADGASLYLTRDIANLRYRIKKYKPEKIFYVVGNEQTLHFEQLFKVAEILGLRAAELIHVKYGLVLAEGGKKFATREGRVVFLEDVIEKALDLSRAILEEKSPTLSAGEKKTIAEAVGIGALKYANLKENRHSDIVFHWEQMLDFSGDSAPYFQYTYARLQSILRKAGRIGKSDLALLIGEEERALILKMMEFPDVVRESAAEYATNYLASYLYALAVRVNKLYETTPVLKEENKLRKNALLGLIAAASGILKTDLSLLGIPVVPKM